MKTPYDVAVVGAGTMGSHAGLHLARAGLSVLLLDAGEPPHEKGAHHGETRLYRQAYESQGTYVPLALEAREGWLRLERESGIRLFHPTGVLNLNPGDSTLHSAKKASAQTWGLKVEELAPSAVSRRWPGFSVPTGYSGLFEVDAGILQSSAAVTAALAGALAAGATRVTGSPVTRWSGTEILTLDTPRGPWSARRVLFTAGTSTAALVPAKNLPVRTVRKVLGWFQAGPVYEAPRFPGFTLNDGVAQYYGFPSFHGTGVKVGRHDGGQDFDPADQPLPFGAFEEDEADLRSFLRRFLPGAAGDLLRGAACRYDLTPDEDFRLGRLAEAPVWYATGFSGHGFKFAPALGRHLARWIAGDERSELLAPFDR